MKPRIAITSGDPAGIGPKSRGKRLTIHAFAEPANRSCMRPGRGLGVQAGRASAEAGRSAHETLCAAVNDARAGVVAAVATAPVNKLAFARAGLPWKGHTDLLAHLTGSACVAMMFWSEPLKVVLATIHIPLASVTNTLTREVMDGIIDLAARELPRFGIAQPRLAVAGLNPHAGEDGLLGHEEGSATGDRGGAEAWRTDRRAVSWRHGVRTCGARRVRRRDRVLPRSGADPGEAPRLRAGRERHARLADHSHIRRPRDGVRYRGKTWPTRPA